MHPAVVYPLLFHPGEVVEIRAFGLTGKSPVWDGWARGVVSGYFNNAKDFGAAAAALDAAGATGVYFTLNPANPALLSRAKNKLKAPGPKDPTTADKDIVCLRWLYIDLDPDRPAGISAAAAQLALAVDSATTIRRALGEYGLPAPVAAMSGNGVHLLYRLPDLAPTDDNRALVRAALAWLQIEYGTDAVKVDEKVYNPARICKAYGTVARKGDNTEEHPHRRSRITPRTLAAYKSLEDIPVCDISVFENIKNIMAKIGPTPTMDQGEIVEPRRSQEAKKSTKRRKRRGKLGPVDVGAWLTHYGYDHRVKDIQGGKEYCFTGPCLFDPNHGPNEAGIQQFDSGKMIYHCFHDSCKVHTFKEARQLISGDDPLKPFMEGYDPDFIPRGQPLAPLPPAPAQDNPFDITVLPPAVPEPEETNPDMFFVAGALAPKYSQELMASYIINYKSNLVFSAGEFWHYENGLWSILEDYQLGKIIVRCLREQGNSNQIKSTLDWLKHKIHYPEAQWLPAEGYINCANGVVDVAALAAGQVDGCLLPHDPKYGFRYQLDASYNPDAPADRWYEFLQEIFPERSGDQKRDVLQRFAGYALTTNNRHQVAMFLYGSGANGKSMLLRALEAMVGTDNVSTLSMADLNDKFKIRFLHNTLLNLASETNTKDPLATDKFKSAVAGDLMIGEAKHTPEFKFKPYCKFVVSMNEPPLLSDKTVAMQRRLIIVEFNKQFSPDEQDPYLEDKLIEERDGILTWALAGLAGIESAARFEIPNAVKAAGERFKEELSPIITYVKENFQFGAEMVCPVSVAYRDYQAWTREFGVGKLSRPRFVKQILGNFPAIKHKRHSIARTMHFIGMEMHMATERSTDQEPFGSN